MTNLNGLIEEIRQKGVQEAQTQAEQIISEAETRAAKITEEAKVHSRSIIKDGKEEVAKIQKSGKAALQQAHRDLLITIEDDIKKQFSSILTNKVNEVLKGDSLASILQSILQQWDLTKNPIKLSVNQQDLKKIQTALNQELQAKAASGLAITGSPKIDSGFRLSLQNDNVIYDFTAEEISDSLLSYLSTSLNELLQG